MSNHSLAPREKLLRLGSKSLSDAELLALFLRTGIKNKPVLLLATEVLTHFGGIRQLINTNPNNFSQIKGLSQLKWIELQAAIELAKRYFNQQNKIEQKALTNPDISTDFLKQQLRDKKHEVFAVLYLDNKHRILAFEEVFHGTIDMISIHARPIIERVLFHNAAALILAHNHPSGSVSPSECDIAVTKELKKALNLIDTRLLDHIIIADNNHHSMAQHHQLD